MVCKFCEKEPVEYWFSNYCASCRKIKNLANVYGFDRVLCILEKCCIRNEDQLENKIRNHNESVEKPKQVHVEQQEQEEDTSSYNNTETDITKEDEKKEYLLRRKSDRKLPIKK